LEKSRESAVGPPIRRRGTARRSGFQNWRILCGVKRTSRGLLALDAASASLTPDVRSVIEILANQIAIAIDDSRLLEENVRLERELAERERLAALGRMAATVAHEIKNPLSAIKSIAQVMREDESLKTEYERDLSLIVGETDRLSQSITQLLSLREKESPRRSAWRRRVGPDVRRPVSRERREQGIELDCSITTDATICGQVCFRFARCVVEPVAQRVAGDADGGDVC
jgi:signal transduction histidine kinase